MFNKEKLIYTKEFLKANEKLLTFMYVVSMIVICVTIALWVISLEDIQNDMKSLLALSMLMVSIVTMATSIIYTICISAYKEVFSNFEKNYRSSKANKIKKVKKEEIWDIPLRIDLPMTKLIYDKDDFIVTKIMISENVKGLVSLYEYHIDFYNKDIVEKTIYYSYEEFIYDLNQYIKSDVCEVLTKDPYKGWC